MAKAPLKKPAPTQRPTQAIAPRIKSTEVGNLRQRAMQDAGKGSSSRTEDNLIPLVYILHSNSPQVAKKNNAYVDGAVPGSIFLRGPNVVIDGDLGAAFQPCSEVRTEWLEWLPNNAGLVGRHPNRPEQAKSTVDAENGNRIVWKMPNGNELVESRFFVGYIGALDEDGDIIGRMSPFVLPFKGTGHTVARGFNSMIRDQFEFQYPDGNIPTGAGHDPSWAHIYRMITVYRENSKGAWFLPQFTPLRQVQTEEEYDRGARLFAAFASGEVRAAADDTATEEEGAM